MEEHYIPGTTDEIYGEREQFSFGVDSILLSAFARAKRTDEVLDLCSGNGIVALRIARLSGAAVTGVEIQPEVHALFAQAAAKQRLGVRAILSAFQDLDAPDAYDLVTVNPPYFRKGEGISSANEKKLIARHEVAMTLADVFTTAKRVLRSRGRLVMIHRPHRLAEMCALGSETGLMPSRLRMVKSRAEDAPKMVLMEFRKDGGNFLRVERDLVLYRDGEYTDEVLRIYEGESC